MTPNIPLEPNIFKRFEPLERLERLELDDVGQLHDDAVERLQSFVEKIER